MPTVTVRKNGRMTIPREIRDILGLAAGDQIDFFQLENGRYEMVARNKDVRRLKGIIPRPPVRVSIEEMNATIARRSSNRR